MMIVVIDITVTVFDCITRTWWHWRRCHCLVIKWRHSVNQRWTSQSVRLKCSMQNIPKFTTSRLMTNWSETGIINSDTVALSIYIFDVHLINPRWSVIRVELITYKHWNAVAVQNFCFNSLCLIYVLSNKNWNAVAVHNICMNSSCLVYVLSSY